MTLQTGMPWMSLTADYLIAETALPEQLMDDANLWLDQARSLLQLARMGCSRLQQEQAEQEAVGLRDGIESLDRLLQMAQGCISQAHRRLLQQQLAACPR
ncbi:hypothetical protein ACYJW8_06425 [Frateuria aurantia]